MQKMWGGLRPGNVASVNLRVCEQIAVQVGMLESDSLNFERSAISTSTLLNLCRTLSIVHTLATHLQLLKSPEEHKHISSSDRFPWEPEGILFFNKMKQSGRKRSQRIGL